VAPDGRRVYGRTAAPPALDETACAPALTCHNVVAGAKSNAARTSSVDAFSQAALSILEVFFVIFPLGLPL
jgi:hypothetical protein